MTHLGEDFAHEQHHVISFSERLTPLSAPLHSHKHLWFTPSPVCICSFRYYCSCPHIFFPPSHPPLLSSPLTCHSLWLSLTRILLHLLILPSTERKESNIDQQGGNTVSLCVRAHISSRVIIHAGSGHHFQFPQLPFVLSCFSLLAVLV